MTIRQRHRRLRRARIAVSIVLALTAAVLIGAGYDGAWGRWQIMAALGAGTGAWLLVWLAVTLVCGRIYCSTACPLGTVQEWAARLGHRGRYRYTAPYPMLRWVVFFVALGAEVGGIAWLASALDPGSAYRRIIDSLALPAIGCATFAAGSACAAALTLLAVAAVAVRRGRLLCNTICPVGTILGALSRDAVLRIDIDPDRCTCCGRCADVCPSECIDYIARTVDCPRCVVCLDCTAACPCGAITYRRGRHRLQIPMLQEILPAGTAPAPDTCAAAPHAHDRAQKNRRH